MLHKVLDEVALPQQYEVLDVRAVLAQHVLPTHQTEQVGVRARRRDYGRILITRRQPRRMAAPDGGRVHTSPYLREHLAHCAVIEVGPILESEAAWRPARVRRHTSRQQRSLDRNAAAATEWVEEEGVGRWPAEGRRRRTRTRRGASRRRHRGVRPARREE